MSTASVSQDQAYVAAGANEELAGPPHAEAPVGRQERISSIDALRGFALLGILLMNIPDFAYPEFDAGFPVQMVHPVFRLSGVLQGLPGVAAMWTVNLVVSTFWVRLFQFGPLEWAWRSLTYWKKQPMLLVERG